MRRSSRGLLETIAGDDHPLDPRRGTIFPLKSAHRVQHTALVHHRRRRPFTAPAWLALTLVCASQPVLAVPSVGAPLPAFDARDLTGQARASTELVGRPAFVAVLTSRGANASTRGWMLHAADRLRGTDARLLTVITLDLPRFVPDAVVRSAARGQVPRDQWSATWLDRSDRIRCRLGIAKGEPHAYVFALDAHGAVVASAHGPYNERDAQRVFAPLASSTRR